VRQRLAARGSSPGGRRMPGLECRDRTKGLWRLDISPKVLRPARGRTAVLGRYALGKPGDCNVARHSLSGERHPQCQYCRQLSNCLPLPDRGRRQAYVRHLPELASRGRGSIVLARGLAGSPLDVSRPSAAQYSLCAEIALGRIFHTSGPGFADAPFGGLGSSILVIGDGRAIGPAANSAARGKDPAR
jgi:hypothetical protein